MITITTEKIEKSNGVYDIEVTKQNGEVIAVKAIVTAQISQEDDRGYTLHAKVGTIIQNNKGTSITGEIPSDILPDIIREFNEIVEELKNSNR